MPLEEYRRKRDFEVTAEPRGDKPDGRPRLVRRFVVQFLAGSRGELDRQLAGLAAYFDEPPRID